MMREKVIAALKQKGNYGEQKDGMDMAVISLDLGRMKMEYASANAFFYVCDSDGSIEECRGNRFPVGIYGEDAQKFELFHRNLKEGDTIYSFTDGYADQFGGEKNKKFMYRRLRDLITENHHLQIDIQKEIFEKTLIDWMGEYEQIDDICLIGVHLPISPQ
jgi:serine phosphatase RsbU (regulator of sigma subunit)